MRWLVEKIRAFCSRFAFPVMGRLPAGPRLPAPVTLRCRDCGTPMEVESMTTAGHKGEWWLQAPCPCGCAIFVADKEDTGKWLIDRGSLL